MQTGCISYTVESTTPIDFAALSIGSLFCIKHRELPLSFDIVYVKISEYNAIILNCKDTLTIAPITPVVEIIYDYSQLDIEVSNHEVTQQLIDEGILTPVSENEDWDDRVYNVLHDESCGHDCNPCKCP